MVDEQGATLAAADVLRLVEAQRPEMADRARSAAAVTGEQALRGVLDHDRVHAGRYWGPSVPRRVLSTRI
jgi:hypothetical protein